MRILLIGIGGVYNYGCEAIVRGTERILRRALPDAEIVYHSPRPKEDSVRLAGCSIEVRPRYRTGGDQLVRRLVNKPFRLLGRPAPLDIETAVAGFDFVLSIGGDIYTQYGGELPRSIWSLGENVMRQGVPYAVWGASIGPFQGAPSDIAALMAHFRRCRFIAAREQRTIEYLRSQGVVHNVVAMLDPAFALGTGRVLERSSAVPSGRIQMGVNLSPLSTREAGAKRQQMVAGPGAMLGRLAELADANILLLPHVVAPANPGDDDLGYLRQVWAAVPLPFQGRVRLLEDDPGFLGIKPALRSCDMVLAARMHCGINVLSEGVPVIFLAYSEKAWGVAERAYGHHDYVLDVRESDREGFARKVMEMLPRLRQENLGAQSKVWQQEALQTMDKLSSFMAE